MQNEALHCFYRKTRLLVNLELSTAWRNDWVRRHVAAPRHRFAMLRQFCGGLATVFPGSATVESDFSSLKCELDEFRSTLMELSLEGVMQCKQFKR
jgi:hypothetical protein